MEKLFLLFSMDLSTPLSKGSTRKLIDLSKTIEGLEPWDSDLTSRYIQLAGLIYSTVPWVHAIHNTQSIKGIYSTVP